MPSNRDVKKREKKKPQFDLLCECDKCKLVHAREERKRVDVKKEGSVFLFAYVCPKCGAYSYVILGDTKMKKRNKKNDA